MTVYINVDTMEYPRFIGDVQLNPNCNWEEVLEVEQPDVLKNQVCYESAPEFINNKWTQKWNVRSLTEEEINERKNNDIMILRKNGISEENINRIIMNY